MIYACVPLTSAEVDKCVTFAQAVEAHHRKVKTHRPREDGGDCLAGSIRGRIVELGCAKLYGAEGTMNWTIGRGDQRFDFEVVGVPVDSKAFKTDDACAYFTKADGNGQNQDPRGLPRDLFERLVLVGGVWMVRDGKHFVDVLGEITVKHFALDVARDGIGPRSGKDCLILDCRQLRAPGTHLDRASICTDFLNENAYHWEEE